MNNMESFLGSTEISLSEAMQRIDRNTYGILFLTDERRRLIGCITDGDIRRYLLAGGGMDKPAVDVANKHPRCARSFDEARAYYHKKNYVVIPIIDADNVIVDLFCGDGNENDRVSEPLGVPVVINAGGKGTRLEPFTKVLPKPLIPVGDLPIIELIIAEYRKYSCDAFHIIVNYKRDLLKAYFHDNEKHYDISWYDEDEPLGTGGGLCLLKGKIHETFFFANCDVLLKADYAKIIEYHKANHNTITMICANKHIEIPYGVIETEENGEIREMKEKPVLSFMINTGIYVVEPEVLDDVEEGVPVGFPDIAESQRKKGRKVAIYPVSENDWMDMGQLSELEKMRTKLFGE